LRTSSPLKPPGSHALANAIPANPKRALTARQQYRRVGKTVRRNTSSSGATTPVSPLCAKSSTNSFHRCYNPRKTHAASLATQTHHRLPPLHGLFPSSISPSDPHTPCLFIPTHPSLMGRAWGHTPHNRCSPGVTILQQERQHCLPPQSGAPERTCPTSTGYRILETHRNPPHHPQRRPPSSLGI
jgi:hypothetical protein